MLYCNFLHYYYLNSFSCVVVIVVICNNNFKPNSFLKHSEHLSYTAIKIYTKIFFFLLLLDKHWRHIVKFLISWFFSRGERWKKKKQSQNTRCVKKKNTFFRENIKLSSVDCLLVWLLPINDQWPHLHHHKFQLELENI